MKAKYGILLLVAAVAVACGKKDEDKKDARKPAIDVASGECNDEFIHSLRRIAESGRRVDSAYGTDERARASREVIKECFRHFATFGMVSCYRDGARAFDGKAEEYYNKCQLADKMLKQNGF